MAAVLGGTFVKIVYLVKYMLSSSYRFESCFECVFFVRSITTMLGTRVKFLHLFHIRLDIACICSSLTRMTPRVLTD